MRAVRCRGSEVEVVEIPPPAGDGVRVRVRSAGICGSDLHMVRGALLGDVTLGHEIAGIAEDGTPVAVEPLDICGECAECRRGDYNLCCKGPRVHGASLNGGMAEEMLVPARALAPLPAGLALRNACLAEPLAVAVHGLRRAGLRGDQRVAVVGGGAIGLCAVAVARAAGARVALSARHDAQREAGARLGATQLGEEGNFDLVVEAAGSESALAESVRLSRPGGCVCIVGSYWSPVVLPGFEACMREVTLVPAFMYGRGGAQRDIEAAVALLAANPELPAALITHRFPLDAAVQAFDTAADRVAGALKVVLEP